MPDMNNLLGEMVNIFGNIFDEDEDDKCESDLPDEESDCEEDYEDDECGDCPCGMPMGMPFGMPMPIGVGVAYVPDDQAKELIEKMCAAGVGGLTMDDLPKNVKDALFKEPKKDPSEKLVDMRKLAKNGIKKVIYNDPCTIVFWEDGSKTVVRCQKCDEYSKETGLAMAMLKKFGGNNGAYNEVFKKWCYGDEDE